MDNKPNPQRQKTSKSPTDSTSAVYKRRKAMREALETRGSFTVDEIMTAAGLPGDSLSRQSLKGDLAALKAHGKSVTKVGRGHDARWTLQGGAHPSSLVRAHNNPDGKEAVGLVALGLIVGFPPEPGASDESIKAIRKAIAKLQGGLFNNVPSINQIDVTLRMNAQEQGNAAAKAKEVYVKLTRYWNEMYRIVAIDSSTTNDKTVNLLVELPIPVPRALGRLCALSVASNSREAAFKIGAPNVAARVLIIGGEQVGGRPAIAGRLAEVFLRAAALYTFGIAFIGASHIDLRRDAVMAADVETASIKVLLCQKSILRVICVDHTKLGAASASSSYEVFSLSPEHVDLILVNRPQQEVERPEFEKHVERIRSLGVPVYVC